MIRTISILCVCLFSIVSIAKAQQYGDECWDAVTATLAGPNYFDTSNMYPSNEPEPDESMCDGTYLYWNNSPDMWFVPNQMSKSAKARDGFPISLKNDFEYPFIAFKSNGVSSS